MEWIVFDIETAHDEIKDDEITRYLAARKSDLNLSTHPLFSKVIHIGVRWKEGEEHFSDEQENEILNDFWHFFERKDFSKGLERDRYDNYVGTVPPIQLVTYNGDGFDVPFINIRSALYRIKPTIEISTYKYRDMKKSNHFDCLNYIARDEFKNRVSLDIACRLLGISIPEKVSESILNLYRKKEWNKIEQKNTQDLQLTLEVYKRLLGLE